MGEGEVHEECVTRMIRRTVERSSPPFFASDRGELGYLRDRLSRLPARNDAIIAPWLRSKIIDGSYYIVAGMELSRRGVETS